MTRLHLSPSVTPSRSLNTSMTKGGAENSTFSKTTARFCSQRYTGTLLKESTSRALRLATRKHFWATSSAFTPTSRIVQSTTPSCAVTPTGGQGGVSTSRKETTFTSPSTRCTAIVPGIGVRPYALAGGGVSFANARRPGGRYQIWIPCRRSTRTGQVSSGTTVLPSAHREFNDILRRHIGSNHQHWATIMTIVLLGTW
ncbi:hypothetical protein FA13DRAFT_1292996 [Coprinellus micaceus]|uniref:Uncharacterized protein n=1 Tax=Coprinellus micaceus TaxID=71717 RepID=A0A4Y7STU3_COPMI|nr:hypothetical protein FA13DRAFT_1292996 [Coprinellus micaceus]